VTAYVPRTYQHDIERFIVEHKRCLIFAGMGTGKSPSTLSAIATLLLLGEARRVLILAPKRVALSTWKGERDKFSTFHHLSIAVAVGSPKERLAALQQNADITVCTYDLIEWLVEQFPSGWPFDLIVCDEASKLKSLRVSLQRSKAGKLFITGQGGKRAKALVKVAFKSNSRFVGLTGTPAPNGIQDLWGLAFFVDLGHRLGTSFTAFQQRYFRQTYSSDSYTKWEPMPHAQKQVEDALRDVCITIEAKDYFDLPPLIENQIKVQLPPDARRHYVELEKTLFTQIANQEVEVFNAATLTNKCLQLASGAAYTDDKGSWVEVHDEKLDALESVVNESMGMPILVAYQFKSDRDRILKRFSQARALTQDAKMIDAWNAGKIPMLVVHPASAGHGLSLQHGGNILVFFSTGWSLENHLQVIERIGPTRQAQSGYNRSVFVHYLVAEDTIEEAVIARINSKASVQDSLLQALKRHEGKPLL
jgi:SNF2 family DNA or RNA helicase